MQIKKKTITPLLIKINNPLQQPYQSSPGETKEQDPIKWVLNNIDT